jgi:hypothetical protein
MAKPQEKDKLSEILKDKTTLFSLKDIGAVRAWDFSRLPTLTRPHRFTQRNSYQSDKPFFDNLAEHNNGLTYKILSAVGAFGEGDQNDVVMSGDALVDMVLKRSMYIRDFDLRLVGDKYIQDDEACVSRAKKFAQAVVDAIKEKNEKIKAASIENDDRAKPEVFDLSRLRISRTKSTITVVVPAANRVRGVRYNETRIQFSFAPVRTADRRGFVSRLLPSMHQHGNLERKGSLKCSCSLLS